MTATLLDYITGAAKCIGGKRAAYEVQLRRAARCADCPIARLGEFAGAVIMRCNCCECIVGWVDPFRAGEIEAQTKDKGDRKALYRLNMVPLCKTAVEAEKCPAGCW